MLLFNVRDFCHHVPNISCLPPWCEKLSQTVVILSDYIWNHRVYTTKPEMWSRWQMRKTGSHTMLRFEALCKTSIVKRVLHWPGWSLPSPVQKTSLILGHTLLVSDEKLLFFFFNKFLGHLNDKLRIIRFVLGPEEDLPRKIEYLEFVCHAPSEYFKSRSSPFPTIPIRPEKGYIWTHIGPAPSLTVKESLSGSS